MTQTSDLLSSPQQRADRFLLLAGKPFTGKSTSALTFPKPRVLNLDNKLPQGTPSYPFFDPTFVDSIKPRANAAIVTPNTRDAIQIWLGKNVPLFTEDETLIIDSLSAWDAAFHMQTEDVEGVKAADGGGQLFGRKLKYFNTCFNLLAQAKCRVIVIAHTQPIYDPKGNDTGKVKALMSGSFAEKIGTYCTGAFHQIVEISQVPGTPEKPGFRDVASYYWTIKPNRTFESNILLYTDVEKIPATYSALQELIASCAPKK